MLYPSRVYYFKYEKPPHKTGNPLGISVPIQSTKFDGFSSKNNTKFNRRVKRIDAEWAKKYYSFLYYEFKGDVIYL